MSFWSNPRFGMGEPIESNFSVSVVKFSSRNRALLSPGPGGTDRAAKSGRAIRLKPRPTQRPGSSWSGPCADRMLW